MRQKTQKRYVIGENVKATFDNGQIEIYSDNGTIWESWIEAAGLRRNEISSIRIAEGIVILPDNVDGYKKDFRFFGGMKKLQHLDLNGFITTGTTSMQGMFMLCPSLEQLDLKKLDTSGAKQMNCMFAGCSSLTKIQFGNFHTEKVADMNEMFMECHSLTDLDLSSFDTSNVTNMGKMFYNCTNLTNLDLRQFDTSKVTDMNSMFDGCKSIQCLDVSHFNTSKVTDMSHMFANCKKLKRIIMCVCADAGLCTTGMFTGCPENMVVLSTLTAAAPRTF